MCNYCEFGNDEDESCYPTYNYAGDLLPFIKDIGVFRENLEVCVLDDVEYECRTLQINSNHLDARIEINFCPMCGRKL